uniref:Uncharacterized protein n=1 Tax=Arundo donax TaxID=35708 RepID=A0A0A9GYE1_ARUDO
MLTQRRQEPEIKLQISLPLESALPCTLQSPLFLPRCSCSGEIHPPPPDGLFLFYLGQGMMDVA